MTLDHIGAVIIRQRQLAWGVLLKEAPQLFALRAAGRMAFPIFAFLLAEGMRHTRSRRRFIMRLALFALISELPFDLAFYGVYNYPWHQNIFFTLFLGAVCIAAVEAGGRAWGFAATAALALLSQLLHTDYAAQGVVVILLFWLLSPHGGTYVLAVLALFISLQLLFYDGLIFLFGLLSLPVLLSYNGTRGGFEKRIGAAVRKWFFYLYYPAHLLALALLTGH